MPDQGTTFTAFIQSQYDDEVKRTERLTASASTTLTTSAAFLALVVASAALVLGKDFEVTGTKGDVFAAAARVLAVVAVLLFALSAFFSWSVQQVRPAGVTAGESLVSMATTSWNLDEIDARNITAKNLADSVISLRAANNDRADNLQRAGFAQITAYVVVTLVIICAFLAVPPKKQTAPQVVQICGIQGSIACPVVSP